MLSENCEKNRPWCTCSSTCTTVCINFASIIIRSWPWLGKFVNDDARLAQSSYSYRVLIFELFWRKPYHWVDQMLVSWFNLVASFCNVWFTNLIIIKGQTKSKWFFQADVSSKKQTNEFDFTTMKPQVDLFSFLFWKKLKAPKRHSKINWPLDHDPALENLSMMMHADARQAQSAYSYILPILT